MPTTQAPSYQTPVEQLGYVIGDTFVVLADPSLSSPDRIFDVGSIVTLFRDDGSSSPLFRLVSGACKFNLADGRPGAYYSLDHVNSIDLSNLTLSQNHTTDTPNIDDDYDRAMGILN